METVLNGRQLTDAELGCRLLLIRIHDLCRYARGELRHFNRDTKGESFFEFFASNTQSAQRELDSTPIDGNRVSTARLVERHCFSASMAQHLAVAIAGKLSPVVYRDTCTYPTAFAATPEIAFDVAQVYREHRISDWQGESENERVADCHRLREWIDSKVPPTLLWGLWQRMALERNLYLAWAAERGTPVKYSIPNWFSLDHRLASAFKITPHYLAVGEAELQRDADGWEKQNTSQEATQSTNGKRPKAKASAPGEADAKILAALCKHHEYADGGCGNFAPISARALAKLAQVGTGSVTNFWKRRFTQRGHEGTGNDYRLACANDSIGACLRLWSNEQAPEELELMAEWLAARGGCV